MRTHHPAVTAAPPQGSPVAVDGLGPYSRMIDRASVDGRSREGRFLRRYEAMLIQHAGDTGSVTIRLMAARAARLALHLELMDERLLAGKPITGHDSRTYLAWSNGLVRLLKALGVKSPPGNGKVPSLADYVASKGRGAAA